MSPSHFVVNWPVVIRPKRSIERIKETLYWAKNDADAFGYYSATSEQIWMKSGALGALVGGWP